MAEVNASPSFGNPARAGEDPAALGQAADPDMIEVLTVVERFSAAIRVLDLYRQQNPTVGDRPLRLLQQRLVRARSVFQKVASPTKSEK